MESDTSLPGHLAAFSVKPLHRGQEALFLSTGTAAYSDHYCHLWPGGNPDPYLRRNFRPEVLRAEQQAGDFIHWLLWAGGEPAGICTLHLGEDYPDFHTGHALLADKIYFRKKYTGMGYGGLLLDGIRSLARKRELSGIWLKAMQHGPALRFYRRHGFRIIGSSSIAYPEVLPEAAPMWVMGSEV